MSNPEQHCLLALRRPHFVRLGAMSARASLRLSASGELDEVGTVVATPRLMVTQELAEEAGCGRRSSST